MVYRASLRLPDTGPHVDNHRAQAARSLHGQAPDAQLVLDLQRFAGNTAVTELLMPDRPRVAVQLIPRRRPAPKKRAKASEPTINTADELRDALAKDAALTALPFRYPYGGAYPGDAAAEDGHLYLDPRLVAQTVSTGVGAAGATTESTQGLTRLVGGQMEEKSTAKGYAVGITRHDKLVITVAPGQTAKEMASTLYHENIHAIHKRALRKARESIARENATLYEEIFGKWHHPWYDRQKKWRERALKMSPTGVGPELEKRLTGEFKGIDVSNEANGEVLAYAEQFKWTLAKDPATAASTVGRLLVKRADQWHFDAASAEARARALTLVEDACVAHPREFATVWPELLKLLPPKNHQTSFLDQLRTRPRIAKLLAHPPRQPRAPTP
jgi:hypothetical protein